jgi:hypothetical protein
VLTLYLTAYITERPGAASDTITIMMITRSTAFLVPLLGCCESVQASGCITYKLTEYVDELYTHGDTVHPRRILFLEDFSKNGHMDWIVNHCDY